MFLFVLFNLVSSFFVCGRCIDIGELPLHCPLKLVPRLWGVAATIAHLRHRRRKKGSVYTNLHQNSNAHRKFHAHLPCTLHARIWFMHTNNSYIIVCKLLTPTHNAHHIPCTHHAHHTHHAQVIVCTHHWQWQWQCTMHLHSMHMTRCSIRLTHVHTTGLNPPGLKPRRVWLRPIKF